MILAMAILDGLTLLPGNLWTRIGEWRAIYRAHQWQRLFKVS